MLSIVILVAFTQIGDIPIMLQAASRILFDRNSTAGAANVEKRDLHVALDTQGGEGG